MSAFCASQVLSWTLWGGVMRAYSPTKLTDNFFLGGATSLRGFGMWGTGPRHNGIVYMNCTCTSQNLSSKWQFLYITLSGVHFVLYRAVFVQLTLGRTFCAVWSTFCTSHSRAYILCCIEHFLHVSLLGVHFVLYGALFAHLTLGRTFCAV